MQTNDELRLAVLIDADNAPRKYLKNVMEEIAVYGVPTIKRIYGDWTTPNLAGWKRALLEHAITPIQQYAYTTGKNSTDSALIIDAMDILYSGNADGFCLVSSDSDFTRLATRLREAGKKVIGIGEKKTPGPFIAACNNFSILRLSARWTKSPSRPKRFRLPRRRSRSSCLSLPPSPLPRPRRRLKNCFLSRKNPKYPPTSST